MKTTTLVLTLAAVIASYSSINAQTSATATGEFTLQGKFTTMTGSPVVNGQHTITTKVYSKVSGQVVYTETDNVMTMDGVFSTMIGDNGTGGATLNVKSGTEYELGVAMDGQAELSPRIKLGSAIKSLTADVAANADAVGGFHVSTADSAKANTIVALNGNGKLRTSLLDSSVVTSINGVSGNVSFQGGGDLNVNTSGNTVSLSFNGSGALNFPFTKTTNLTSGSSFSITNTLAGSAASFTNIGLGSALQAQAASGSAISATSSGSLTGAATVDVHNTSGSAIKAVANASGDAVVEIKNQSSSASAKLLTAMDASGNVALDVAANGKTTIQSSVGNALDVTTSATGEAALKVTGGLTMNGPVGTGQVMIGQTQTTISNVYAKANSIILITVTGGGSAAVPLQLASQTDGSFVVSVFNGVGALTGNVKFSYLIVNQ